MDTWAWAKQLFRGGAKLRPVEAALRQAIEIGRREQGMTREQHMALGEAISELCNPEANWKDRTEAAMDLRKQFGFLMDHEDGCASEDPALEPEDIGNACDCGFWNAIYPADMKPAA